MPPPPRPSLFLFLPSSSSPFLIRYFATCQPASSPTSTELARLLRARDDSREGNRRVMLVEARLETVSNVTLTPPPPPRRNSSRRPPSRDAFGKEVAESRVLNFSRDARTADILVTTVSLLFSYIFINVFILN